MVGQTRECEYADLGLEPCEAAAAHAFGPPWRDSCDLATWECSRRSVNPNRTQVAAVARFHLTPYHHADPIVVMAYSAGKTPQYNPSASATATVTPGVIYTVMVEVLREDLGSSSERYDAIRLGDSGHNLINIGGCNPDGGDYDCTFFEYPSLGHEAQTSRSASALHSRVRAHVGAAAAPSSTARRSPSRRRRARWPSRWTSSAVSQPAPWTRAPLS